MKKVVGHFQVCVPCPAIILNSGYIGENHERHSSCLYGNFFIVVGIAGCATTGIHTYAEPEDENAAVIESTMIRESTFFWTRFSLLTVDDRFIGLSAWGVPRDQVRVPPGLHKINVNVTFNQGFGNPQMSTVVPIEFNVLQGVRYVLQGRVIGTRVEVWLNDTSGQRASSVGSGALGVSTVGPVPMMVPMPLPK